ncbi:MAG TPA: hypothetical protein ENH01_05040 [Nitrospirae bacterium]|nr:hypothetical protein [Nitrospirota bacterium]
MKDPFNSYHVGVAAEAFVAAMFARCGYDVSVQYGANQPEYDLIVKKHEKLIPISVKGSKDGAWGLTQSFMKNADYKGAVDQWLKKHNQKTIFCLVQFKKVELGSMPRIYLATPKEIAKRLKDSAKRRGDTILYEYHEWSSRAYAAGTIDKIPDNWKFSTERIEDLFKKA